MSTIKQTVPVQTVEQLKEQLGHGPVSFGFVKKAKDGFRKAVGTTNLSMIPADKHPKGLRKATDKAVAFYDLLLGNWRSVSSESLVFAEA